MTKLVSWGAWTAVVIWSLLCWAAMALIDVASGMANNSTDTITGLLPISESMTRTLIDLADDLGEITVVVTWLIVSALILGGAALIKRAVRTYEAAAPGREDIVTLRRQPGEDHWKA